MKRLTSAVRVLAILAVVLAANAGADELDERIRKNRMGELRIEAAPGATVRVEQVRHEFWFGAALANSAFSGRMDAETQRRYRETFLENFNAAVTENALKWHDMERRQGQVNYSTVDAILAWTEEHGIPLRGHNIFWGIPGRVQPWLKEMDDEALYAALRERATTIARRYKGRFAEYDLNNEMIHGNYYADRLGAGITKQMAAWVKQEDPSAKLYLNDYDILTGNRLNDYLRHIRGLQEQGALIDGIGVQGHLHGDSFDAKAVGKALDALAETGLPICITEFNFPGQRSRVYQRRGESLTPEEEQAKADALVEYYRICFAHPGVKGILMWGFWEGANWIPQSSLYRRDWTPTPAADAYKDLIYDRWWTRWEGKADANGVCRVPAFFGRHRVTVDGQETTVDLKKAEGTATIQATGRPDGLGVFDGHGDVGSPAVAGSAEYDADEQVYTVAGAGANMWFGRDEFQYAWKRMKGDFIVRARARFVGEGVNAHRKLGWIVRSGLDADSPHVNACVHGDGLTSLQFRRTAGGDTEEVKFGVTAPDVIQLERRGDTYVMSVASFGEPFAVEQVSDVGLGEEVFVGLYVCSHEPQVIEKAVFENVRIVRPAPADLRPYRDYLGSRVEIMEVASGRRRVVHSEPVSLQAPNWTPDGRALIYNSDGLLYRFDLVTRTPAVIDTGFARQNNNDHVISFDGTQLGISNYSEEDEASIVYVVPIEGGEPKRVTEKGPSYLHGWSPDGGSVVYTGQRDGQFDIYRAPVDGGPEVQLTDTAGLDDGPEYAPDGKTIWFNSSRTGTMQIWRMGPDGSGQTQVTFDEYNDWFPHVSPDGRRVVFLSFPKEVDATDHPFYKRVYLRMMPAAGGEPRVIGYVYGGQGTINVPSWSPDSGSIAFVSNSAFE